MTIKGISADFDELTKDCIAFTTVESRYYIKIEDNADKFYVNKILNRFLGMIMRGRWSLI